MDSEVSWHLELALSPGKVDEFRSLMNEMIASTKEEPGTLSYSWFISDDASQVHIYERYVDSDAVMAHMATFGERFAARFMAAVSPTRFCIFGSPSAEVKALGDQFGASYYPPFGGFAR